MLATELIAKLQDLITRHSEENERIRRDFSSEIYDEIKDSVVEVLFEHHTRSGRFAGYVHNCEFFAETCPGWWVLRTLDIDSCDLRS